MQKVIYGGSYNPPHYGHLSSENWISRQGFEVLVVPSIAHEFKQHLLSSYLHRREMSVLAFGEKKVFPLEEQILHQEPMPIRAIDILRYVRDNLLEKNEPLPLFAIGPDIIPSRWSGIKAFYNEGFEFLRLPETLSVRSTLIRENISMGQEWESFVPKQVGQYIRLHKLYGFR